MTTNEKAAENIQGGVLIRVADLHKSFGKLDVLKGIDTEIRRGEVLVVIGPSGVSTCWKSPPAAVFILTATI